VQGKVWNFNWLLHSVIPQSEQNQYEIIWTTQDQQTSIHYIEDFLINVNYILAKDQEAEKVIEQVRSVLPTYNWQDIQAKWTQAGNTGERVQSIYYAAIVAPQTFDQAVMDFFEVAPSHSDTDVRLAVIVATGYLGWSELRKRNRPEDVSMVQMKEAAASGSPPGQAMSPEEEERRKLMEEGQSVYANEEAGETPSASPDAESQIESMRRRLRVGGG
jgi:hypothetical protein